MNKKIKILFIITFVFTVCSVLCNRVYAIDTNAGNGAGTTPASGNYYSVKNLKIRISIVDSSDKTVYPPKIYPLYGRKYTAFFPQWFRTIAEANSDVYSTKSCFGSRVVSKNCKYSGFLNIISDYSKKDEAGKKEAEKFIKKISDDLAGGTGLSIDDLAKYYLKFEPYYTIETYTIKNSIKITNTTTGTTRGIISALTGNGKVISIDQLQALNSEMRKTFYNFIISIYSVKNDKFIGLPFYLATDNNGNCEQAKGIDECLNYYYNWNSGDWGHGLGVGYLKISDFICSDCKCKFESVRGTMVGRIELYKSFKEKGSDFRKILDMNTMDANEACSVKNVDVNKEVSCLSANVGANDFSDTNLSNYTSTIEVDGVTGYCNDSLRFYKKLSSGEYYRIGSNLYFGTNEDEKYGGQMILQRSENGLIGVKKITRTCYAYGDKDVSKNKPKPSGTFTASLERNDIEEMTIKNISKNSWGNYTKCNGTAQCNVFVTETIDNYSVKPIYAEIVSGKLSNSLCPNCKFLGYGLISKLSEEEDEQVFEFKITYTPVAEIAETGSAKCYYETKKKGSDFIKDLRFRIIDILDSFPGKSGDGRKVGFNWCDGDNCEVADNSVIKKVITDANNSFNIKAKTPLYKITLNSSDIKKIRDFNKKHSYSDFTLTCERDDLTSTCKEGKNYESQFLKNLLKGSALDTGIVSKP